MVFRQILSGANINVISGLVIQHHLSLQLKYIGRFAYLVATAALLSPVYLFEKLLLAKKIKETPDPNKIVFIIGHWRSGTTFLHNTLCKTGQFHYLNTYQAFLPNCMYYGGPLLRWINKLTLPVKRPMDNMAVSQNLPQEEEFAMACITKHSYYHSLVFPKKMQELAAKYLFNQTDNRTQEERWQKYVSLIKKINFRNKSNRFLLLKNPALTTQIIELKKRYPFAKFIYLKRNEVEVKQSMLRMYQKLFQINNLQNYSEDELKKNIDEIHSQVIATFDSQKPSLSKKDLLEIDFSELTTNPLQVCNSIFSFLDIHLSNDSKNSIISYLASQKDYRPNFTS